MYDLFGIRYNSFGLLNSYDDAKKVYEFYEKNQDLFEPEPYDFWLMLSYPLNSKKPILEKKGEE